MTLSDLPSYINSLLCWLIILRVIFWKRNGRRYKPAISLIAWILVISCSGIAVFLFFGHYRLADWDELFIHALLCLIVYRTAGNVATLLNIRNR